MTVAELRAEHLMTARPENQVLVVWRRFRRHKLAVVGLGIIMFIVVIAAAAPVIARYPRDEISLLDVNVAPDARHWLGTDELGRDVLSRLMYAARVSIVVGFTATIFSELVGILIGAIAGYYGGWTDTLAMRFLDFVLTIPLLPVLLVLSRILATGGGASILDLPTPILRLFGNLLLVAPDTAEQAVWLIIILIFFGWMQSARLIRGMILSLRELDYTDASRAVGMPSWQIILRHMIPNSLAPIIVDATLAVGNFIVLEAALSFLGFGIRPPVPTWGNMLSNVQEDMWLYPWKALYPGFCIFITSLSFNFAGDALRDALDPRLKM